MRIYIALVHQEGDSAYGVQFPDVPGCFSAADELEDLIANASEALALHLEDEAGRALCGCEWMLTSAALLRMCEWMLTLPRS